ncbi:MAG TPA: homoserine O-succinyltransferase [Candidatus Binataceae bacterium]|nr:homoserine O-succinyltransferase [Candidatus Binataceae bacterium]
MNVAVESSRNVSHRGGTIVIGLVNNMPDAALQATEQQFYELLAAAAGDRPFCLRYFTLPEIPRGEAVRARLRDLYESLSALWTSPFDGLIVTGTEPRADELSQEPYWDSLRRLIDWSASHTISTVWSCLAAHAAVLHLDGIRRRRLAQKLSGVFLCERRRDHRLAAGGGAVWSVPHSRYNDLPLGALEHAGYCVLSSSAEVGADAFIKDRGSLDVFFQGHFEYQPDTLLREYRRDVARYLAGHRDDYPEMPRGYFSAAVAQTFEDFRRCCLRDRSENLLKAFPRVEAAPNLGYAWRGPAVRIYANWLEYLAERKGQDAGARAR